jgi:hypothetical protein
MAGANKVSPRQSRSAFEMYHPEGAKPRQPSPVASPPSFSIEKPSHNGGPHSGVLQGVARKRSLFRIGGEIKALIIQKMVLFHDLRKASCLLIPKSKQEG